MKPYVWLIGGGRLQLPMACEIIRRGFALLVTDREIHCDVREFLDEFVSGATYTVIPIDTYAVDLHVAMARNLTPKPIAVLTAGADVGPTVSAVAEALQLRACSFEAALATRNKACMRARLDLPHPVYLEAYPGMPPEVWESKAKQLGVEPYPCVVKALDNAGSRGMTLVENRSSLDQAINYAAKSGKLVEGCALIEEKLHGSEYALDFLVEGGQVIFLNASSRLFSAFGIESGHINPYIPPSELITLAEYAVGKLGITEGPFKMDVILDPRFGFCILECATRLSGGFDHMTTCRMATGKDITGVMLDYALGLPLDHSKLVSTRHRYACAYAPVFPPGRVKAWVGVNRALRSRGVEDVYIRLKDYIPPLRDCAARPVFVIATGKTGEEALENAMRGSAYIRPKFDADIEQNNLEVAARQ